MGLFVRAYGGRPLHLAAVVIALAFAAYAIARIFTGGDPWMVMLWLVLAIVAHDLVLLPLYTLAYALAQRFGRVDRDPRRRVPVLHHVTVPTAISGLLFIAWLPEILRRSEENFRALADLPIDPYLWRWLAVTGGMFALSALVYGLRRWLLGTVEADLPAPEDRRVPPGAPPERPGEARPRAG